MTRVVSRSSMSALVMLSLASVTCGPGKSTPDGGGAGGASGATGDAGTTGAGGATGGAAGTAGTGGGGMTGGAGAAGAAAAAGTSGGGGGATGATGGAGAGGRGGATGGGAGGAGGATGGAGAGGRGGTAGSAGAGGRGGAAGSSGAGGAGGAAGASGTGGAAGGAATTWPGTRTFGTTTYNVAQGMTVDGEGNIYLGGECFGSFYGQPYGGMNDLFVLKVSPGAAVQWAAQTHLLGEEWGYEVALDPAGNVYLAGATWATVEAPGFEAVLIKHDRTGARQWLRQFGTPGYDYARGVVTDAAGNVYVAGDADGPLDGNTQVGRQDLYLAKFDGDGTRQWTRQFGSTSYDYFGGVAIDGAGNLYIAGYTDGAIEGDAGAGAGLRDGFVVKLDGTGTPQWTRTFGTAAEDYARGIAVDGAGGVYVVGSTGGDLAGNGNLGGSDAFIIKYDTAGTRVWTRQFGADKPEDGRNVVTDAAGNIYVAGGTGGIDPLVPVATGQHAVYLARFDSAGTMVWLRQTPQLSNYAAVVAVDPRDGNVFLSGRCLNAFDGVPCGVNHIFVMKFTPAGVKL